MYRYPLTMTFKVLAFVPQVKILDSVGQTVLYVKQKLFAMKEDVKLFADEQQTMLLFQVKADRVIDFSARYTITAANGAPVGAIKRQGMRSIWKATYDVFDANDAPFGLIHESNPWIKVADAVLGEIPFVSMFINPTYIVELRGQPVLQFKKQVAFFESSFKLEQTGQFSDQDEQLLLAAIVMMMMLERSRG